MVHVDTACRKLGREASRATRIAVVDDDASVRNAIRRFLKTANFRVDLYARSIDFLGSLHRERPDCLILDIHMPTLTGIDLLEYLRTITIDFGIVIVSADDGPGVREACSSLGAVGFLRKPLDGGLLLQVIETVRGGPPRVGCVGRRPVGQGAADQAGAGLPPAFEGSNRDTYAN